MKAFLHRLMLRLYIFPKLDKNRLFADGVAVFLALVCFAMGYVGFLLYLFPEPESLGNWLAIVSALIGLSCLVKGMNRESLFEQGLINLGMFLKTCAIVKLVPTIDGYADFADVGVDIALAYAEEYRGTIAAIWILLMVMPTKPKGLAKLAGLVTKRLFSRFDVYRVHPTGLSLSTPFTDFDKRCVSIHEAGHAVIMGLDPLLNDEAEVYLAQGPKSGSFGYCRRPRWKNHVEMLNYVEMEMIGLVAGGEAEHLAYGAYGTGCSSDNDKWMKQAEYFLRSTPAEVYFSKPNSPAEIEHNRQVLLAMKQKHQAMARSILQANWSVVERISESLAREHRIKGKPLLDLLADVVPVEGMPDLTVYKQEMESRASA